jgi:hypothetical protein
MGVQESRMLEVAIHAWISFAEQSLVDAANDPDVDPTELAAFLERSALGVLQALDPAGSPVPRAR